MHYCTICAATTAAAASDIALYYIEYIHTYIYTKLEAALLKVKFLSRLCRACHKYNRNVKDCHNDAHTDMLPISTAHYSI